MNLETSSNPSAPPGSVPGGAVAVLTAAGSGSRLGADVPKALVEVGGVSLLRRAAAGLLGSGVVDHLVVTAPQADVERFRAELDGLTSQETGIEVVAGSAASRQASVALGLEAALAVRPGADVVVVHDAARALTPPEVTRRVVAAVRAGYEAVVPALPVTDTVKEVSEVGEAREIREIRVAAAESAAEPAGSGTNGSSAPSVESVVGTPQRSRLRAVQTPQGFDAATLVAAHRFGARRAQDETLAASDDAGLVEACGGRVVVVAGDERAMKVTTPMDLALAELLAAQQTA